MSKEKPIIFSTEMVKAVLADRKTKTRRLNGLKEINENPDEWDLQSFEVDPELMAWNKNGDCYPRVKKGLIATFENNGYGEVYRNIKCPWEVGDVLWVGETWNGIRLGNGPEYWYRADEPEDADTGVLRERWRPSTSMPRATARLFLEVKAIQVERLQDITEEDARAEGVIPFPKDPEGDCWADGLYGTAFQYMWNKINGWNPNAFELNSWVWAVEFERVTP